MEHRIKDDNGRTINVCVYNHNTGRAYWQPIDIPLKAGEEAWGTDDVKVSTAEPVDAEYAAEAAGDAAGFYWHSLH
jgi:hypothetical protein